MKNFNILKKISKYVCLFSVMISMVLIFFCTPVYAETKMKKETKLPSYTIGPDSKPCTADYMGYTYGPVTKNCYTLRSYMERFEKKGGGTLTLKKGTYYLNNTVYIPSNVKIIFKDGVILKKTYKRFKGFFEWHGPSTSMFMFCAPSVAEASAGYEPGTYEEGITEHNGVHDIVFKAKGKCVIDLGDIKDKQKTVGAIGLEMGHNRNVTIQGITFRDCQNGHFIELDAGKNIKIKDCTFLNMEDNENKKREAINIDNPELKGFTVTWSSYDKTGNEDILIEGCSFKKVNAGIGDHNITEGYPHKRITVKNCVFDTCYTYGIHANNWEDSLITGCTFKNMHNKKKTEDSIPIFGDHMKNIRVEKCIFKNTACILKEGEECEIDPDDIPDSNSYDNAKIISAE